MHFYTYNFPMQYLCLVSISDYASLITRVGRWSLLLCFLNRICINCIIFRIYRGSHLGVEFLFMKSLLWKVYSLSLIDNGLFGFLISLLSSYCYFLFLFVYFSYISFEMYSWMKFSFLSKISMFVAYISYKHSRYLLNL